MKIKIIYIVIFSLTLLFLSACRNEHEHNCEEVIVDPTCTTDGYKIINCCCSPEYKIILNKTGHNYIDGICTNCSLKESINVLVINNGSTYTITLNYGEVIEIENYEFLSIDDQLFKGWYLNDELFDFSNPIKSNITLTAKYNNPEQFYNIEYIIDDSYLYYSSKEELLNDFLIDFYEFVKPDISFKAFAYGLEGSLPLWTFFIGGNYSDINKLIYNNDIDAENENYFFNCSKYKDKWYMLSSYMKNNICKSNKRFGYSNVEYNYGALDFYRYLVNDPGNYLSTYGGEKVFYSYPLNEVSMISSFEYNSGFLDLYIPSNNSFKGWYKDESFTDGPYTTIDTNYIGNITLFAKITSSNIYKIEFETKSDELINPIYVETNSIVNLPEPIKDGCDFLGWYLDYENLNNEFVFNFECDIKLTAKWDDPNVIESNYINYDGKTITYRNSFVAVEIPDTYKEKDTELRACWVSSFIKNFTPSNDKDEMIKELTYVLDFLESYNMNCMIFHVRTHNNAFYNTNLAPIPSEYGDISSFEQWDYLEWLIDECHKRGIEFHAWLNPYRIKLYGVKYTDTADVVAEEYTNYPQNPASNPNNILLTYYTSASGGAILNPAKKEVQDYIVNVCLELASKYNIDGIHFDDYFYQRLSFDSNILEEADQVDYIEYIKNNTGSYDVNSALDKEDWRRMNVNDLIMKIHLGLTELNLNNNRNVKFGISPTGKYKSGDGSVESGSNTAGGGHYSNYLYADTVKWINEEWIDYIMPQCYTSFNNENYSFHEITTWWNKVVEGKKCNLYIGIGIHNSISSDYTYSWKTEPDELINQLLYLNTLKNVKGVSLFSFSSMKTIYNKEETIAHNSFIKLKNELWLHKVKIEYNE